MLTFKDAERLFRVRPGGRVRLKDHDPGWAGASEFKELQDRRAEGARKDVSREEPRGACGGAAAALCQRRLLGSDRAAGDGRGREGRHHQARHVGDQPAGLPGVQLQEAIRRGARPQLSLALHARAAGARPDRYLQSLVLRGRPRRARPSANPGSLQAAPGKTRGRVSGRSGSTTSTGSSDISTATARWC